MQPSAGARTWRQSRDDNQVRHARGGAGRRARRTRRSHGTTCKLRTKRRRSALPRPAPGSRVSLVRSGGAAPPHPRLARPRGHQHDEPLPGGHADGAPAVHADGRGATARADAAPAVRQQASAEARIGSRSTRMGVLPVLSSIPTARQNRYRRSLPEGQPDVAALRSSPLYVAPCSGLSLEQRRSCRSSDRREGSHTFLAT